MDKSPGRLVIHVSPDLRQASLAMAEEIVRMARSAAEKRGLFALALSGGSTPRYLYRMLAGEFRDQIPWQKTYVFWGDERCVPEDHPASNYRRAYKDLLANVAVAQQNIFRIPAEIKPPEKAAETYEKTLRKFFGRLMGPQLAPLFDLIVLGVGEDGHIASLFPGQVVLNEQKRWAAAVLAPPAFRPRRRITLTLPLINQSNSAFFLVSGSRKRQIVRSVLATSSLSQKVYPAALVRPRNKVVWFVDQAAWDRNLSGPAPGRPHRKGVERQEIRIFRP